MARDFDPASLAQRLRAGERSALARAITLVESRRADHREQAGKLLGLLFDPARRVIRIGVTGPPGAGKSTLIEALGLALIERGHTLAVLAIDPTSRVTGGSILGDKTRMEQLARRPEAFIRPSPSGDTLGGIARRTREAMLLCEAAGFSTVMVETVGVGQAETLVDRLVDSVLLVALPGAGDELQGIKRGIMETADVVAVNKADGANAERARQSATDLSAALRILPGRTPGWRTRVHTVSALEGRNLDPLLERLEAHRAYIEGDGRLERQRAEQAEFWLDFLVQEQLKDRFLARPEVIALLADLRGQVRSKALSPDQAAAEVLAAAFGGIPRP